MAHQSPMISIPKKTTEEVDWTTPIKNLIAKSYGENPDNYATECASLQRCRQDAVRGAGSDFTGVQLPLLRLGGDYTQAVWNSSRSVIQIFWSTRALGTQVLGN